MSQGRAVLRWDHCYQGKVVVSGRSSSGSSEDDSKPLLPHSNEVCVCVCVCIQSELFSIQGSKLPLQTNTHTRLN